MAHCKLCHNSSLKEHNKQYKRLNRHGVTRTEKLLRHSKKEYAMSLFNNICFNCKGSFHPVVYDFHHTDPREKDTVINFTWSWKRIEKELKKCIMLCSNCHRVTHWAMHREEDSQVLKRMEEQMQSSTPMKVAELSPSTEPIGQEMTSSDGFPAHGQKKESIK